MPLPIIDRDTYIVSVSSFPLGIAAVSSILTINNNSPSTLRLNCARFKPVDKTGVVASTIILEGWFLSASSTGGTNQSSLIVKMDPSSANLNTSVVIVSGADVTVSGRPVLGGGYQISSLNSNPIPMYLYRGGEEIKQVTLRPGSWFSIIVAPQTILPSTAARMSFLMEFTVDTT